LSSGCTDAQRKAGVKGDAFTLSFGRRMAEAVMAHGLESGGQHMVQVTPDELHSADRVGLHEVPMSAVFPAERDLGVGDGPDAGITNGSTADVGAEVLDGVLPVAKGQELDAPVHAARPADRALADPGPVEPALAGSVAERQPAGRPWALARTSHRVDSLHLLSRRPRW